MALEMLSYLGTPGVPGQLREDYESGLKDTYRWYATREEPVPEIFVSFKKWCDVVFELIADFAPRTTPKPSH